jgi:hypothetical protein
LEGCAGKETSNLFDKKPGYPSQHLKGNSDHHLKFGRIFRLDSMSSDVSEQFKRCLLEETAGLKVVVFIRFMAFEAIESL